MARARPTVAVLGFPPETTPAGDAGLEAIAESADVRLATTQTELERALSDASVLLVLDFRADVLEQAWPAARHLQWLHAASAGVEHVMFPALRDSPVVLTNARGVFDAAVAEWVLGVMLVFCKDLHTTLDLQSRGTWQHRETQRLAGRTVLVIGAGGIGRAIAKLTKAAGMVVTVAGRTARTDAELGTIIGPASLDDAIAGADFVVLAAPLTAETHGLMSAQRLAAMRPDARFVNVGRGELVDEPALRDLLRTSRIGGAALDVFATEPLPPDDELWAMPNVIVSPHMAGDVIGWRRALVDQFAANLRRWIAGEPLANVVDKNAGYATTTGAQQP